MKWDYLEASDFMFEETYKGERIMAAHEVNGKIYIFTPNNTYVARKYRWYEKLWDKICGRVFPWVRKTNG